MGGAACPAPPPAPPHGYAYPASLIAEIRSLAEHHLGRGVRMLLEIVLVEAQIGAALRLRWIEAAALGHGLGAVPLELGEIADGRVVERDGDAAELPLLPHLLVAAHHGEAEVREQGHRLLGALHLELALLAHLDVPLEPHRPLEGQPGPAAVGAQPQDPAGVDQLPLAVEDPVVLEGRGTDPLGLELDQALAQLVQLHPREFDLALEIVPAPHRLLRRSSNRATERMPL